MPKCPFQIISKNKQDQHIIHDVPDPEMHEHCRQKPVILTVLQDRRRVHCAFCIHEIRVLRRTCDLKIQEKQHIQSDQESIYISLFSILASHGFHPFHAVIS